MIGGVAGLTADANSLVNYARSAAQRHLLAYNEDIPVELLAQKLCDLKQGYTQFGGTLYSLFAFKRAKFVTRDQVFDHSVSRFFMLVMIPTINSNSTTLIRRGTTLAGRLHVLAPTMERHRVFLSRSIRMRSL